MPQYQGVALQFTAEQPIVQVIDLATELCFPR